MQPSGEIDMKQTIYQTNPRALLSRVGLLALALALGGCAGMTAQDKGTAVGAVVGGVAGNVLCGGLVCTGVGAAVGGVVGHEVSK
jgi:osmotically inducible lipoprotein OsmB